MAAPRSGCASWPVLGLARTSQVCMVISADSACPATRSRMTRGSRGGRPVRAGGSVAAGCSRGDGRFPAGRVLTRPGSLDIVDRRAQRHTSLSGVGGTVQRSTTTVIGAAAALGVLIGGFWAGAVSVTRNSSTTQVQSPAPPTPGGLNLDDEPGVAPASVNQPAGGVGTNLLTPANPGPGSSPSTGVQSTGTPSWPGRPLVPSRPSNLPPEQSQPGPSATRPPQQTPPPRHGASEPPPLAPSSGPSAESE